MDIEALLEGVREAAQHLRTGYDMKNHAVAAGTHAQVLDADFIHRFGVAGPLDQATLRVRALRDTGIDFVRVVSGSRDMPRDVASHSIQAPAKIVPESSTRP